MLQKTKVSKKIKIVTLGGGTGGYVIDKGLSQYENIELTSIVNSFDSGGSTGRLRDEFGGLPTGDIRRRILAHSNNENNKILREIFSYRFESNGVLNDHSLGNIILTSAMNIWGNDKGINNILKLFNINGKVLNITHDEAELCARLDDNSLIISETKIDLRDKKDKRKIKEIFLSNKVSINPIAKKALLQADTIVICPGDLYTSILPIFLVNDIRKIMKKSKARIIYISNLFTKYVETKDYNLDKFVEIVENNINKKLDHIVYNIGLVHKEVVHEYSKVDKANLVYMSKRFLENNKKRIISEDVINKEALKNRLIRHDSYKCAEIIMKLSNPKLFIWDLDDTIINTTAAKKDDKNINWNELKVFDNNIIENIKNDKYNKHILLSGVKYNKDLQMSKINTLGLKEIFSEINLVDYNKNSKKKCILSKIKKYKNYKVVIIGDRDDGELEIAHQLRLDYVKVSLGGKYQDVKGKYKSSPVLEIKDEKDFVKIWEV